ncbi:excalibur calcium-binding domain-containing protein [Novosphingobium sp. PASSN1]|uniref:excalibur calcium-binding domain-containing protein n=1 Tax=Novosphingobium sp. PASSN1 TaxID=2015561 RepID=UPI000BC77495|nr:MAG: hypothetical protein CFE35_13160 [Novosphingobium sp. PASSN1]
MKRKAGSYRTGYVVLAVLAFVGGRWSVEAPTTATSPRYLAAPTRLGAAEQVDAARLDAVAATTSSLGRNEWLSAGVPEAVDTRLTCEGKRYCREMNSCAEANFYLNQCGVGRLDGDGDGIPCESIC